MTKLNELKDLLETRLASSKSARLKTGVSIATIKVDGFNQGIQYAIDFLEEEEDAHRETECLQRESMLSGN